MHTHLHTSPSAAVLADTLSNYLAACAKQVDDPFISPLVFVPNLQAGLWLRRSWAQSQGIVMNIELPYLERGIRESFLGNWRLVGKSVLTMAIMAEFLEEGREDWLETVFASSGQAAESSTGSLAESFERRLWGYASLLAEHFDNYDLHRYDEPTMDARIRQDPLQGRLRQRVRERIHEAGRRDGESYLFLRDLAGAEGELNPSRIQQVRTYGLHLFAFAALSPLHLAVLQRIAREAEGELHLWQIAPLEQADNTGGGHWNLVARSLRRLLGMRSTEVSEQNYPDTSSPFAALFSQKKLDPAALRIVGAPTLLREVEMIYNSILWHLAADPSLRLNEIVVFVPDLAAYRPVIDAVFAAGTGSGDLRGQRYALRHEYLGRGGSSPSSWATGLALLVRPWQASRERLYELLTNPALLAGAGLERSEIESWFQALAELGSYRGTSLVTKVPAGFSFAKGLARLRLARVLTDQDFKGLFPSRVCDEELAGRVMSLVEHLESSLHELEGLHQPGAAWRESIARLAETFLGLPEKAILAEAGVRKQVLQSLYELDWLPECGFTAIATWLGNTLAGVTQPPLHGGGIMIAGMQQVRPVPFRLVFIAGMGEGLFPSPRKPASPFDLLEKDIAHFPGDIEDSDRERMLFVETLLAVQERLIISYCNRDILTDSPRYPSPLVTELLCLVGRSLSDIISLPLLGWSAAPELARQYPEIMTDYIHLNGAMARPLPVPQEEPRKELRPESSPQAGRTVSLYDLAAIIKEPSSGILRARYLLDRTAGLALALEADEPFLRGEPAASAEVQRFCDNLSTAWLLSEGASSFEDYLLGPGRRVFRERFQDRDRVPVGFFGELYWEEKVALLLKARKGLERVRARVKEASANQQLWSPFVFGRAPALLQKPTLGPLLAAVPLRKDLALEGRLPLVWLEEEGRRLCLYDKYETDNVLKNGQILNVIPQLIVALPSIRAGLGLPIDAEAVLVSPFREEDNLLHPAAEQEACLQRVLALLDSAEDWDALGMLLPARKLLEKEKALPTAEDILLALQEAENAPYTRPVQNPAQIFVQPTVPPNSEIKRWYETMLVPWIRMLRPGWNTPQAEEGEP